ncbi:MAG TPA: S-layer homology domain-containing protein, partial [Thermoanaerobaculia bacterium]|nr:S-layer homology domain-containing protein [Thermoanaerobaculia bacterium]
IEQFYRDGITRGCSPEPLQYCKDRPVTRAEMAVFLLRARHGSAYVPPSATGLFADVPLDWMASWIEQLYREGITQGCGSNPLVFCPQANVTRSDMAAFLTRTFELPRP